MPELPEVESVCQLMRQALQGSRIVSVQVAPDEIVLGGTPSEAVQAAVLGRRLECVGRKGKFWWLGFDEAPCLFGHLGMSGWIRELGGLSMRLHSHGDAPFDDSEGKPRFLKLLLEGENGRRIAFTDGRRLGRLWLNDSPATDPRVQRLGPDAYNELPPVEMIAGLLTRRKAPIKAVLLDQAFLAGIGNWIADEVLYRARLAPQRLASSLNIEEVASLHHSIQAILKQAVDVNADYTRFPENWLFHHRWGGDRCATSIEGREIVRDKVGGRTTAWVPEVQK